MYLVLYKKMNENVVIAKLDQSVLYHIIVISSHGFYHQYENIMKVDQILCGLTCFTIFSL